jgi:hypothetical protein
MSGAIFVFPPYAFMVQTGTVLILPLLYLSVQSSELRLQLELKNSSR